MLLRQTFDIASTLLLVWTGLNARAYKVACCFDNVALTLLLDRASKLTRSVNMSKSYCFALAVICLLLETDAHLTVDEPTSWSSAAVEVRIVPVHHQQNGSGKKEIERCGETNGTRLEDVAKEIKDEIGDVKKMITSECGETNETTLEEVAEKIKEEIKHEIGLLSDKVTDVKKLLLSGSGERNETIECDAAELSKQALVSALVSSCIPLLVQQNVNGSSFFNESSFFNRSWAEFKVGFNDSIGNYWLGNELLSQLTVNNRYKLKFDLQSRNHTSHWYHAEYSTFRVLPETQNYKLQVTGYSGNAGYDAFGILNGAKFSTYDRDNDRLAYLNCAVGKGGGFWYESTERCALCGVNGARSLTSFWWWNLPGGHFLQSSRMWLQCKQ